MNYEGELQPLKWFLKRNWKIINDDSIESDEGFMITFDELDSIITAKEIPIDYKFGLELEDENGTQYKKGWFKKLKLIKK